MLVQILVMIMVTSLIKYFVSAILSVAVGRPKSIKKFANKKIIIETIWQKKSIIRMPNKLASQTISNPAFIANGFYSLVYFCTSMTPVSFLGITLPSISI